MTQPEDEDTKEHPAFPEPLTPAEPVAPADPTPPPLGTPAPPPMTAPAQPAPQPWQPQAPTGTPTPPTPPSQWPQQPQQGQGQWPQQQAQGQWPQQSAQGQWPQQQAQGQWPQQQAQGQWQQPGYGAPPPGWAPQAAWAQAGPRYQTLALVALAGLVLILFGLAVALLGGWTLTQGPEISRFIRENDIAIFGRQVDRETLRSILSPMPGILMVVGVLGLIVGAAVLAHRGVGRWLGVLLALLGVLVGVVAVSAAMALVPGVSVQLMVSAVLLLGYAFVLLALIAGGSHFRARYPSR